VFTDGTVGRLASKFYRSKLTGWMAQQEENYRFILLQANPKPQTLNSEFWTLNPKP
jgi:lysophospholipid hydrolase